MPHNCNSVRAGVTGVVRRAAAGPRAQHSEDPGVVCDHTGADHVGVPGNQGIQVGAG